MISDSLGKKLTIGMNDAVKAFISSEILLWSAWNFVIPIFSVLVVENIPGGTIQIAAFAFTSYLLSRMVFELIVSQNINHLSTAQRAIIDIAGMTIMSVAYIGLALYPTLPMVFGFYVAVGLGLGIAAPAKLSLFSSNLQKDSEARVWGIYDVSILMGMAVSTSLGGIIATTLGFQKLLLISAGVNIVGVTPYLFYIRSWRMRRQKGLQAASVSVETEVEEEIEIEIEIESEVRGLTDPE